MTKQTWNVIWVGLCICMCGCGWQIPDLNRESKKPTRQDTTHSSHGPDHPSSAQTSATIVPMKKLVEPSKARSGSFKLPMYGSDVFYPGQFAARKPITQRMGQEIVAGGFSTGAFQFAGDLYVTGYFTGTMEIQGKRLTSAGGEDGFIAKFDRQGVIQWLRSFGGKGNDRVLDVAGGCNRLYVVGGFSGEFTADSTRYQAKAERDGFIAEFSPQSGQFIQVKATGFENSGEVQHIAVGHKTCNLFLAQQMLISSWLPNDWSKPRWQVPLQSSATPEVIDLQLDDADNLAILGSFFRFGGVGPKHYFHGYGVYVAYISASGEEKWVQPIQVYSGSEAHHAQIAIDGKTGRVVVAGTTSTGSLSIADKSYSGNSFVAEFDLQGQLQWVATTAEVMVPEGLHLDKDLTYVIGRFSGQIKLGDLTLQAVPGHPVTTYPGAYEIPFARMIATLNAKGKFVQAQIVMKQETSEGMKGQDASAFISIQGGEFLFLANFREEVKSASFASYTQTHAFLILKFTAQGTTQWMRTSGNGNSEVLIRDAATDTQGYIYRVISFAGKIKVGSQQLDSKGGWKHALLKQDPQGRLLWVQWFRSVPVSIYTPLHLAVGTDGSATVVGTFSGCAQFSRISLCSKSSNGYLARWSTDGSFLGANLLREDPEKSEDAIYLVDDVVQTANGTITVAYRTRQQSFLSQWSAQRSHLQELSFGSSDRSSYATPTVLAIDAQSNVYLTGDATAPELRFGHLTLQTVADKRWSKTGSGFVAKLSHSGRFVWAKSFWDTLPYMGRDIIADAKGNITITGAFRGTARFGKHEFTSGTYNTDGFIAQLDTNGQVAWAHSFRHAYVDPQDYYHSRDVSGNILTRDASGHTYLYGSFREGVHIGKFTLKGSKTSTGFLAKLSPSGTILWAELINAQVQRLLTYGTNLLLFGQARSTNFTVGEQTFQLPNNNTDLYALLPPRP